MYSQLRSIPQGKVDIVMTKAREFGWEPHSVDWANLGQGSPFTGEISGDQPRLKVLELPSSSSNYTPIGGIVEVRKNIADFYNKVHRRDCLTKLGVDNISITPGGRPALARIMTALGDINIGFLNPDYSTYSEIMTTLAPSCGFFEIETDKYFGINIKNIHDSIIKNSLGVILLSSPCNPTGSTLTEQDLQKLIKITKDSNCLLIMDEFYSRFCYNSGGQIISISKYIEDIENSGVIIIDGLSKGARYPGWRMAWIIAPKSIIQRINYAGSFLDGGLSHPIQLASLQIINPSVTISEINSLQNNFVQKRDYLISELTKLGFHIPNKNSGAFYIWARLDNLRQELRDGISFCTIGLENKLISIPGEYFDINPYNARKTTKFGNYIRFSFGPDISVIQKGVQIISKMCE